MHDVVLNEREVLLYDTRYPIIGGVRRTIVTPFPPKITIGDYSRDDRIIESSWVLSSFNGGLGIQYAQFPRDQDRFWFGDLETRYRHLTLGPQVTRLSTVGAAARIITDFNGQLHVITDTSAYRLSGSTLSLLFTPSAALGGPVAANVFNEALWIQYDNGLVKWNGTTAKEYHAAEPAPIDSSPVNLPGIAATVWDDKYFRLTPDLQLYYYTIPNIGAGPSGTFYSDWVYCGRLQLPQGYCEQLLVFFDLTGELVIHAVTKVGVWAYDFAARKFYQTGLMFPYTESAGNGAIVWRGELYVPAGSTIYKYNGSSVQNVGPAKDDGLPAQLQGDIVSLVAGHGFYFSVLQARPAANAGVAADTDEMRAANPLPRDVMAQQPATQGMIICSPGVAWHTVFFEEAGAVMAAAAVVSTAEGYRFWFSTDTGLYYTDLTAELHNPLQNPTSAYKESGSLETGWVDLGWAELDKLALYLEVFARDCTETETIEFEVSYDDSNLWESVGTVTRDGRTVIPLGSDEGRLFKNVRVRITMSRHADFPNRTPVMRSANLVFMRRPEQVWGYMVQMQLSGFDHWEGYTPEELVERLEALAANKYAGNFIYRDEHDDRQLAGRVVFSRLDGAERSGDRTEGRYTVSLIELKEPESEFE